MKSYLSVLVFLILTVPFVWCIESTCKIMNLKGAMVYNGFCQYSDNAVVVNKVFSLNGVFFLEDEKNGNLKKISANGDKISVLSSLGRDSLFVVESRNVKNPSNLRALKKEDSQSNEYYLRTHFYAINGIGYGFRQSAWENFDSLFLYVKEDIQQRFPQDTISVGLMFNKTSLNKFTDFIQSIYNMMSETDLTSLGLGFLVYTSYVELVNDLISENNSVVEEIIRRRDELWSEYIV